MEIIIRILYIRFHFARIYFHRNEWWIILIQKKIYNRGNTYDNHKLIIKTRPLGTTDVLLCSLWAMITDGPRHGQVGGLRLEAGILNTIVSTFCLFFQERNKYDLQLSNWLCSFRSVIFFFFFHFFIYVFIYLLGKTQPYQKVSDYTKVLMCKWK